jgi:NAD(P)-dependent dehydrogenase (short-subunit alcohol dehydrogenase family)
MTSNPTYNKYSSGIEIAQAYAENIKGKTVLITGVSTGGIGDAIARAFAHAGAATIISTQSQGQSGCFYNRAGLELLDICCVLEQLLLPSHPTFDRYTDFASLYLVTGRDDTRLSSVHKALSADYPDTKFRPLKLVLDSLVATKQAAQEILDDTSINKIDITIANAGFGTGKADREVTADGIESHFGANHLAHFLFVDTLLPKIKAAAKKSPPGATRIITISSNASVISPIRFSDWNYEKHSTDVPDAEQPIWELHPFMDLPADPVPFSYLTAYAQSKTANILMAIQLNKRLSSEGISAFSLHPGVVGSTGQKQLVSESMSAKLESMMGPPKTIDQGAATVVVAALDPVLQGGQYLEDCQISDQAPAWSTDAQAAEKLWKLSEDIVREKLG